MFRWLVICFALSSLYAESQVRLGVDVFFEEGHAAKLKGKRVALILNQTSVDANFRETFSLFSNSASEIAIAALFSPEHGLKGQHYAWEKVADGKESEVPVFSLHGDKRRPTDEMLKGIETIVYDIQCTGNRAYTYPTTLFYVMEAAAKLGIEVIVLDRPNPINGVSVDGPMLEEKWRSYIGYVNVPYCHGMTIGELARFFNGEYRIGCKLKVIPMKGWRRSMNYRDTGLGWIPPSPNIPEPDTPLYCLITGGIGELHLVNIGIGYTLPFKIVGAPWIRAIEFAKLLNAQNLRGVRFQPYHFRPFWGIYKGVDCEGVLIQITDEKTVRPLAVQYMILGLLKSLYPEEFSRLTAENKGKELFCKACGTSAIYDLLLSEKYPAWKMVDFQKKEREVFLEKRKAYLLDYEN
jgi:uncharacterized protein YbbC (DUF1343 family)